MATTFGIQRNHEIDTVGLLEFSGADANMYCNLVGSIVFNDFQLSVNGQRNIAAALSNLPYAETADNRLTFGWGPDHFIRRSLVHQHGYEHLAVMVALTSVFHEAYAAEVCHAYAASVATEDDVLPHIWQWKRQLRAVSGVLTASGFAQLVEDYIRLDPYSVGPGSNILARRCRVQPKAMAKGLKAISKVICKKEKQVNLVGGAVIGWYAALCEFFYDLRVAIVSRKGEKIHGDAHEENTQVILVYHEEPDLEVLAGHWSTLTDKTTDDDPFWTRHVHMLPFGGRVQWHSLLPQVFGHAYWILEHEEAKTLADLIGGCARGLEGDFEHHRNDPNETFYNSPANAAAYGSGLIQNLTAWLPELRKGQARMERQLKRGAEEAAETYGSMVQRFQKLCNCVVCTVTGSEKPPKDGYCLPVICETIIALGLAVSRMIVTKGIYPTREGVQGFYSLQAEKRKEAKLLDIKEPEARMKHYGIIYANEWKANNCRRLQNAVELFSGTRPEADLNDNLVAIAHEGICAHMIELTRDDSLPLRKSDQGFIQITSGAINMRQKIFTRISTEPVVDEQSLEALAWEEVKFKHLKKPLYCR